MSYRKLWITLAVVVFTAFTILGIAGYKGIQSAPPIPARVVTADGELLFTGEEIRNGQNVWQSLGGQEIGSIWVRCSCSSPSPPSPSRCSTARG
jgi:nitric oxide reductase subunit B